MGSAIHEAVLQACRNFMVPIARFLLRNGVTFKEFAEISKWAFVHVASEEYGIRGRRASVSRVSVATGLSRKEVTKLRESIEPVPTFEFEWRIASATLQLWYTCSDFLDAAGQPVALSAEANDGLPAIIRAAAGGKRVDCGRVRQLLFEAGSIERLGEGVVLPVTRFFMPADSECHSIHHFGEAVGNLANTIQNNYSKTRTSTNFERFVWSDSLPVVAGQRFQRILSEQASRMLEMMDDWLTAHEESQPTGRKVGVGVFYFNTPDTAYHFQGEVQSDTTNSPEPG